MKKILFNLFFLVLSVQLSFAQQTGMLQGDLEGKYLSAQLTAYSESGIYLVSFLDHETANSSNFILTSYTHELQIVQSAETDLKYEKEEMQFEYIIHLNDELYLFFSLEHKKTMSLFVQEMDKTSLKPKGELKKIIEQKITPTDSKYHSERLKDSYFEYYDSKNFRFKSSNDGSKFSILYDLNRHPYKDEGFEIHVFDTQLDEIWKKEFMLPYKEWLFRIRQYEISNEGTMYMLAKQYNKKYEEVKNKEPNYIYKILTFSNKEQESGEANIDTKGYFIEDLRMVLTDDKDVICAGLYYTEHNKRIGDNEEREVIGTFFARVNGTSKKIVSTKINPLGKSAGNYKLRQVIVKNNGDVSLIAEDFFYTFGAATRLVNPNNLLPDIFFNHNDILIQNLSSQGEVKWLKTIRKKQTAINNVNHSSYFLLNNGDKLYFILNLETDNKGVALLDNVIIRRKKRMDEKAMIIVAVEFDAQGGRKKRTLSNSTNKVGVIPINGKQVSNNKGLVLIGNNQRNLQLGMINIDE